MQDVLLADMSEINESTVGLTPEVEVHSVAENMRAFTAVRAKQAVQHKEYGAALPLAAQRGIYSHQQLS